MPSWGLRHSPGHLILFHPSLGEVTWRCSDPESGSETLQAPKVAMEYVVVHELAHLRHRNHSPAVWRKLAETKPGWPEAKELLERWEGAHRAV